MDTVSMLNTMSFYCQPILPLVYDESMSYYETLCKVVSQLNTTGDAVNKLNEGLTNEISDRQAADAALDERLKPIEELNGRIHFLVFADANPSRAMPTRSELYNWVRNGDAIYTLLSTNEAGRGQVYAASCTYNAGNWGSEASNDFNIIVPLETKYDSANDYAVKQKVAKLTIPSISHTSLNVPWGLQIIEVNTPSTSAEGVVNVIAVVSDSGSVNCSITPSEFLQLYNTTRGGKNLCVAVNAKLAYDGLARSSSIATVDTTNRIVRIAFERDYGTAITNGVNQLNKTLDYIIGDAKTGTWVHETIDSKIFDFIRYEGFQFTRGVHDVITTDDESTPNAVYAYYNGQSGKLYQNLPTRLIDEVDGAEYWNGVFDSYSDGHITFTFTTANYATIGEKMVVRIIELSSTKAGSVWTGGEKWSYAAKEFEVPYSPTAFVLDVWQTSDTPTIVNGFVTYQGGSNLDFDDILPLVENNQEFVATLHKGTSDKGIEWSGLVYSSMLINNGIGSIAFATTEGVTLNNGIPSMDGIVVFEKDSDGAKKVTITFSSALPAPNPDGSDNGKVPTVNGTAWEMKTPSGGGSANAVLYTPQTLTDAQKKQARENVDAASDFVVNATPNLNLTLTLDKTWAQISEAVNAGKTPVMVMPYGDYDSVRLQLLDILTDGTAMVFSNVGAISGGTLAVTATVRSNGNNSYIAVSLLGTGLDNVLPQISMASAPASDMQIATKKYVDDNIESVDEFKYFTYDARTTSADMTPAEVKAFITANPHTPIYMLITGVGAGTRPILAVQQSWANDTVVFVSTSITRTTGVQEYKLIKAASDTAWGTISTGRLVTDDAPSVANPTFTEYIDGHANRVLGVGQGSAASNENLPYLTTGDYPKDTIDGMIWSDLRLNSGVFAYRGVSIDSIYNKVLDGAMLPDIDFVLSNVVLIGTVDGEITNYTNDYYNIIKDEISRNRGNIWLSFNGETIRLASWKQAGSDTYALTFFGAGAAAQPVKYVVTASASAATLAVTGS